MPPKKSKNNKKKASGKPTNPGSPPNGLSDEKDDSQFTFFASPNTSFSSINSGKKFGEPTTNGSPGTTSGSSSGSSTTLNTSSSSQGERDAIARAAVYKEEGNEAFKAQKFEKAIELYTSAIGEWLFIDFTPDS